MLRVKSIRCCCVVGATRRGGSPSEAVAYGVCRWPGRPLRRSWSRWLAVSKIGSMICVFRFALQTKRPCGLRPCLVGIGAYLFHPFSTFKFRHSVLLHARFTFSTFTSALRAIACLSVYFLWQCLLLWLVPSQCLMIGLFIAL